MAQFKSSVKRPPRVRYASRYLLPIEMFCAVLLLSWGIAGMQTHGALSGVLDGAGIALPWTIVLCVVAAAQLVFASVELFAGRRWSDRDLLLSVSLRCICAFLSVPVWIYIFKFTFDAPGATFVSPLMLQAPLGVLWQAAIFVGNVRTRCLLDPKIPTNRLEREVQLDRGRFAGR